jgi:hypothetical protein
MADRRHQFDLVFGLRNGSGDVAMKLLVTSVRNEAAWLVEWIAYHKAIGFDYFLIYTNDNTDRSAELFEKLSVLDYVEILDNPLTLGESPQKKAFSRGMKRIGEIGPDWVACLDPDEYLNLKEANSLQQLIDSLSSPDAIAINWRFFGSSGLLDKGNGFTTERFLKCSESRFKWNRVFKTLFRYSNGIKGFGPHTPWFKKELLPTVRFCFPDGHSVGEKYLVPRSPLQDPKAYVNFSQAQINHYAIRSRAEYMAKQARGNGMVANDSDKVHFANQYFDVRDRNEIYDDSILRFLTAHKREYVDLVLSLDLAGLIFEIERDFARGVQ